MGIIGKLVRVKRGSTKYEYAEYEAEVLSMQTMYDQDGSYIALVLLENNPDKCGKDLKITAERISHCKTI